MNRKPNVESVDNDEVEVEGVEFRDEQSSDDTVNDQNIENVSVEKERDMMCNEGLDVDNGTQCKNDCTLEHTSIEGHADKTISEDDIHKEIKYHLFMMWGKYGLRNITSIGNGNYVFKFNNEIGLQTVIENGVWIVNNKPMVVQKWDIDVDISKVEPDRLPIWVKLVNLPFEAWTINGLSALASRLGKPVMMDYVTTKMCNYGIRRPRYARLLIKVEAKKGLPKSIDIQYYDKDD
ncbi:zinc knuckle CX2CX4HX4C containing protein [Tanacetum coccineum]|uniref:Zinc knuckle CX2CX4HX4C containing protein n=1 Tax=Tanacetum coccineum TaxID=301880 RepID=A0ABQ5EK25_9ASTR